MTLRDSVSRYHDDTKHAFNRFAPSLGYLDWASQPNPFRSFAGSPEFPLFPAPGAAAFAPVPVVYDQLFDGSVPAAALTAAAVGSLLRHALGLSAWKAYGQSRWSLRVNPSSGNLHPTEAYIVCPRIDGLAEAPGVYHYAADRHALELRCKFEPRAWDPGPPGSLLVMLTSIAWRESWKYGERAFRYCQHDLGHAVAALGLSAATLGWRGRLQASWSHDAIAAVAGCDRDADFAGAEREVPACVIRIGPGSVEDDGTCAASLVAAARRARWFGRASRLSETRVDWPLIDEVTRATQDHGRHLPARPVPPALPALPARPALDARAILLQRRSATAFDGRSSIDGEGFFRMLARVMPSALVPWDMVWWTPRVHLAVFVHRVDGLAPGLYLLIRDEAALATVRQQVHAEFEWQRVDGAGSLPLFQLARGECRATAMRLSCDQDIAGAGFFSLGMIAAFEASLAEYGASFYRHLFWEAGIVGQVLYLEAEAAGARGTGIGCFYDDAVHEALGLAGHGLQSLYHFTVGAPVVDARLTTEPGYGWDTGASFAR